MAPPRPNDFELVERPASPAFSAVESDCDEDCDEIPHLVNTETQDSQQHQDKTQVLQGKEPPKSGVTTEPTRNSVSGNGATPGLLVSMIADKLSLVSMNEYKQISAELSHATTRQEDLRKLLAAQVSLNEIKVEMNKDLQLQIGTQNAQILKLETESSHYHKLFNKAIVSWEGRIVNAKNTISCQQKELGVARSNLEVFSTEAKKDREQWQKQTLQLMKELKDIQSKCKDLEIELEKRKTEFKASEDEKCSIAPRLDMLRQISLEELAKTRLSNSQLQEEVRNLRRSRQLVVDNHSHIYRLNQDLQSRLVNAERELESTNQANEEAKSGLVATSDKLQQLWRRASADLKAARIYQKSVEGERDSASKAKEAEVQKTSAMIASFQSRITSLNRDNLVLSEANDKLERQVTAYRQQLEVERAKHYSEVASLEARLAESEKKSLIEKERAEDSD
ncbi:hypothetical protein B0J11DRAFT_578802 [Dendryphion nanum]|uniref:Uncharacterized protein n=1 Tax=Dendryphion nanum TaxID=256645 RepID=A0A9P9IRK1_9PLEO|nr:hypothetical protein B0J11DRAFT_578802 [Dendryphion nanum]